MNPSSINNGNRVLRPSKFGNIGLNKVIQVPLLECSSEPLFVNWKPLGGGCRMQGDCGYFGQESMIWS